MNRDTPRRKRRREKLAKAFSDDWEVDYTTGPTIRRKQAPGLKGLFDRVFRRRHSVFAMYWFFKKDRLGNLTAQKFHFPLRHDNIPADGVPFKYEMQGSWEINESDLKYLYGGPLIDQHGELIVRAESRTHRLFRVVKMLAPLFVVVSALLAIAANSFKIMAILE